MGGGGLAQGWAKQGAEGCHTSTAPVLSQSSIHPWGEPFASTASPQPHPVSSHHRVGSYRTVQLGLAESKRAQAQLPLCSSSRPSSTTSPKAPLPSFVFV